MLLPLLRPRAWPGHLAMVLAVTAAVSLGVWQWGVWQKHRDTAAHDLTAASPRALEAVMGPDDPFPGADLGRPVRFDGTWMGQDTLYIQDRFSEGTRGYWVVTPVRVERPDGSPGSAMPVVRGWSARATSARPVGPVTVVGWLQPSEGAGAVDPHPHDAIIPTMRIGSIVEHVDVDLYSGYVVARDLTPGAGGEVAGTGLRAVQPLSLPEISAVTSLQNFLYAWQWWFFAGFALFIWGRWCRDQIVAEQV